eukprot:CAMPEP_0117451418 /NCGR_PEP_ID=MMETSP0759-20121206/8995_1 /TAXON_ID=63605 /ORGANISM="Percolomonas cosmopolitus, Strain WS" /LENGTH=221 /DNA_ID=CAMNT_0005244013 /DNA_START=117 /DNA_END=782 /DNA_ORIENTATION=+
MSEQSDDGGAHCEMTDSHIRMQIIDASISHFQEQLVKQSIGQSRRLPLNLLLSLQEYLMNPMLSEEERRGLNANTLERDFGWHKETVKVFQRYFPQLRSGQGEKARTAPIDYSKFFALGLLLASQAHSFENVLRNAFLFFSGETDIDSSKSTKKIATALLKKCLDWYDGILVNDQKDRMIYDCFLIGVEEEGKGMMLRAELEQILDKVLRHVETEMQSMDG